MGLTYKGGAPTYHSIFENIVRATETYLYKDGYFGIPGNNSKVRIIYSNFPNVTGKDFYEKIAYGGIENELENGKGYITKMADGTIITFRPITTSDQNPAVDINISRSDNHGNLKKQKIHFEKGGKR